MTTAFNLNTAVAEYRRTIAERDNPATPPATRKRLEKRAAELRAAYVAWNGDDELAEIAIGDWVVRYDGDE